MSNLVEQTFTFEGDDIAVVKDEETGDVHVSVNAIANAIGIDARALRRKAQGNEVFRSGHMALTAIDGKQYTMHCIPVDKVQALLLNVNANKVREEIREKLLAYQERLADALHDWATTGIAVNPAVASSTQFTPMNLAELTQLALQNQATAMAMLNDMKNVAGNQGETLVQHDSRISVLEHKTGTSQVVHPRMTPQMSKRKVREAYDAIVDIATIERFGTMTKRGIVMNELYAELESKHDLPTAVSRERNSKIARVEDAGLINNLYAYTYHRYKYLLEEV